MSKRENKLNDLEGKEWLKFTKTWFVHNPPPRSRDKKLHPASFPETLIEEFILFFTKRGEWVIDPFLGTGSTLIAARKAGRNAVGIEIYAEYAAIARERLSQVAFFDQTRQLVIEGDAKNAPALLRNEGIEEVDFVITSPPYWNQLKRAYIRQKERTAEGLNTDYGRDPFDIGNIDDYGEFLNAVGEIFGKIKEIIRMKAYVVVITNNVFYEGRLYPLAFDTFRILEKYFVPKDEKIWCQDDKKLEPLGIYNAWVGNRCHQYCLVFRKE